MLTAALDGLVARFGLAGERLGEVVAGAVLKHSRDFNLTRESVLGSALDPHTPAYDVQQACGTGLEAVDPGRQQDRARPDRGGHRRRRRHHLATPRSAVNEDLRQRLLELNRARTARRPAARRRQAAPGPARARHPAQRRAAHRAVDGRARRAHRRASGGIGRAGAGRAGAAVAPAPRRRVRAGLLRRPGHAVPGADARPEPAPGHHAWRSWPRCKPVFGKDAGATMTAGNSTPLTDGAAAGAAGQRGVGGRAPPAGARVLRRPPRPPPSTSCTASEGLLMAPDLRGAPAARAGRPDAADFDFYEIHEAFAVAGAGHAEGVGGPGVLQGAPRPRRAARPDRPGQAQRRRLARWRPATRSPPPAAGSSPRWPSCCTNAVPAAA